MPKGILKSLTLTSVKMKKGDEEEGDSHEALYVKFLPRANFHSCVIKTLKMEVYNGNADRPLTIAA